ncbi:TY-Chap domain-containing protein [Nocardia asteroides]|uniref:TY-Chap domain-containing protein n=1 Tax=Nocardia asteroides TaxID=1824 RepID=UPI0033E6355C
MTGWTEFAEHLAAELAKLPLGARVIVFEPEPARIRRFVQFARDEDVLSAQLIGDRYLDENRRPTPAGYQAITDGGWNQPDVDNGHLWWVDFDAPVTAEDWHRAAELAVTGLRDGYTITSPTELAYNAWTDHAGHPDLDLPTLGLPRQSMQ